MVTSAAAFGVDEAVLESRLCECGCGEAPVVGREHAARQLVWLRDLFTRLLTARDFVTSETVRQDLSHLMWAGERAAIGLDAYAHAWLLDTKRQLGVPTPMFMDSWRDRAREMLDDVSPAEVEAKKWWRKR